MYYIICKQNVEDTLQFGAISFITCSQRISQRYKSPLRRTAAAQIARFPRTIDVGGT